MNNMEFHISLDLVDNRCNAVKNKKAVIKKEKEKMNNSIGKHIFLFCILFTRCSDAQDFFEKS